MTISVQGDPEHDPKEYLRELVRGEISVNPEKLARAYFKLAEQSKGLEQLAYCALGWAVNSRHAEGDARKRVRELEQRVAELEKRIGS